MFIQILVIKIVPLAAMVVLVSCGSGQSNQTPTTSTAATTTTIPVGETTTTSGSATTTETDTLTEAVAAFQEWVAAVANGDTTRAWELMASTSQQALGSYEQFEAMSSGLAEGWGSWVAVEDPSYSLDEDEADRILLTASGVIRPEGTPEHHEISVPLVVRDGELLISPFEEFGK